MADKDIIFTRGSLPSTSTGVSGQISTQTGEGELLAQIGQAGQALGQFGVQLYKVQGESELTQKMLEANEGFQNLELQLLEESDPEQYIERYNQYWSSVENTEVKNGYARRRWESALPTLRKSQMASILSSYTKKVRDNHEIALSYAIARAEQTGIVSPVAALLKTQVEVGYIDEKEAEMILFDTRNKTELREFKRAAMVDPIGMLESIKGDKIEGAVTLSPDQVSEIKRRANQSAADSDDSFDATTGKVALDWDIKLQAWDDPASKNKLTYEDIDSLKLSDFEARYGNDIIKFKEFWRGLLDNKVSGEDKITSTTDMMMAERIIRSVGSGRMTLHQATEAYSKIAPDIKTTDNKSYIQRIFAAEESSRIPAKKLRSDQLDDREKKLRDAIEQQMNFFVESEDREVLQDLANQAVIDLGDKFGELDWEKISDLDNEVDRLLRQYTPSSEALKIMVLNKQILQAESYAEQQAKLQEKYAALIKQGKLVEADILLKEMIELGFATATGKPSKGKKDKFSPGILKRILGL
jgi:hypothetical protein